MNSELARILHEQMFLTPSEIWRLRQGYLKKLFQNGSLFV